MLKEAAIYNFFASFGVPAFEQNSVPTGENKPEYPYITYELRTDAFSEFDTSLVFSVWDANSSWGRLVQLVTAISVDIGRSGKVLKCDGGYVLIMRDSPFAQARAEDNNKSVKRELCSIKVRYYTND